MNVFGALILFVVLIIFSPWFALQYTLSSGDWPYFFIENIREFSFFPQWQYLWLAPFHQIPAKIFVEYLQLPWEIYEKILWFWPFLLFGLFSSWYFAKGLLPTNPFRVLVVLIFLCNTYSLMIVGGGQMGVALAYAISPFVLTRFIHNIDLSIIEQKNKISSLKFTIVINSFMLALLAMFDFRIASIIFVVIFLYFIFQLVLYRKRNRPNLLTVISIFAIPICVTMILHSYWIIPLLFFGQKIPIDQSMYISAESIKYFSFATFEQTISLLHPNWPENIFGKIYFMKPEFLILPIIAFSSLFFLGRNIQPTQHGKLLFFGFLGLLGAFFAKGTNGPFGEVNLWLFENIPGMIMFRDPTKFYILVVLSYSFLIPNSLSQFCEKMSHRKYPVSGIHNIYFIVFATFFSFWLFLIHPAVFGKLQGTFKPQEFPKEYFDLKQFIQQHSTSTILWLPTKQRFAFSSQYNPGVNAEDLFGSNDSQYHVWLLEDEVIKETLTEKSIDYVIIPYDSKGELFLTDRKFDQEKYKNTVEKLGNIPYLHEIARFGQNVVFEVEK